MRAMSNSMDKKKVVVMLSTTFPVGHSKAGEPTEFAQSILDGTKIHTIRADKKWLWKKRTDDVNAGKKYVSVREWTGRPYNSEHKKIAAFDHVGLQTITITNSSTGAQCWIDEKEVPIYEVAKNDGCSVDDFLEFMFLGSKSNIFEGVVIHFTDFRY